jgi:O-antigen/teichoic acid export membrane protein
MRGASFITYFLAGAVPRLGMFVILLVLSRWISLAETGLFTLVVTVGEIIEMTTANWLRVFAQSRDAGQRRIRPLRAGRLLTLALMMYGLAALLVLPAAWLVAGDRFWLFAIAVFAYVTAFAALRLVLVIQQVTHDHMMFARIELVRGVAVIVLVIAAAMQGGATFFEPAMALAGTTLACAILGMSLSWSRIADPRFIARGYGTAVRFGAPIIADTLLGFVVMYFERLVLNEFVGPAGVGVYAIAYALGRQPVDFITGPLNNLTVPVLFATRAKEGEARAREIQTGVSISLFILCAGVFTGILLLRHPFADLFVKPELRAETAWLLPVITGAACILVFKVFLYDNAFFMLGRNALKLKAIIPAAIGGAIGSLVLVRAYGVQGAAVAAVLSTTLALAASIIASRSFFRFHLPVGRLLAIAGVAVLAGGALKLATLLVAGYGPMLQLAAGFAAFCPVYALGLTLLGISLRRLISAPWAPLTSDRV